MRVKSRVVIVGGGFGGLAAAGALARAEAEVLLVDRQNHHLFQPLLYQVATAALSPANIASPIRKILRRQRNCEVLMAEAGTVDPGARTLAIAGRRLEYDYLILAAGAETNYFGHDAWASHAPGLKTVDDAIEVRRRFLTAFERAEAETDLAARRVALTFIIVGAGPTGVEMAGALAEISRHTLRKDFRKLDTRATRVILVDGGPRVLPGYPASLSERARRDLEALGVEIRLGAMVVAAGPTGVSIRQAGSTVRLDASNVIWAAGVRAASIGRSLGLPTDSGGRLFVGDDLTVPGHPELFVVGDLAHRVDPRTGEPVPGVAQGAIQMGRFAGRTVAREIRSRAAGHPAPPRERFVYNDKGSMATIGRNRAVAVIGGWRLAGMPAFVVWAFLHILFLIDFRSRVLTLTEWIWMYWFYERGVRLITGRKAAGRSPGEPGVADDA